jgi:hypothetical protein
MHRCSPIYLISIFESHVIQSAPYVVKTSCRYPHIVALPLRVVDGKCMLRVAYFAVSICCMCYVLRFAYIAVPIWRIWCMLHMLHVAYGACCICYVLHMLRVVYFACLELHEGTCVMNTIPNRML